MRTTTEAVAAYVGDDNPDETVRDNDELDAELALLAHAAEDLGAATETLDVATLTDTEKRLLIALMRERLHLPSPQQQHEHDWELHGVASVRDHEETTPQRQGAENDA